MKVGFYLQNNKIPNIDLSQPELGNPGCGGTEFLFSALPHYLVKYQASQVEPILFANHVGKLTKDVRTIQVQDIFAAATKAKHEGCDFFVYRPTRVHQTELLDHMEQLQIKSIAWAHVGLPSSHLRLMARYSFLKAIVCVEHEQYDMIQDTPVQNKLTYIVNGFDVEHFVLGEPVQKDPNLVVYIGALVPQKGFHMLAQAWPQVAAKHPEAKLAVIGTGNLYDESAQLGGWGIADPSYENKHIIPHLAGADGRPMPSVQFLGKLGLEKNKVLHRALIGVPNPTGQSENCPGSVLEISAAGTAVVSGAYYGMLDTVVDGQTGLLGRNVSDLVKNICSLLEAPARAEELGASGRQFVRERYSYEKVAAEWAGLFSRLASGQRPVRHPFKTNFHRHYKWLTWLNRPLQAVFGSFMNWPATLEVKNSLAKVLGKRRFA